MKKNLTRQAGLFLFCVGLLSLTPSFAQQNKEDAMEKANRAIRLMDEEQKYDDAIRLLQEAEKLDPDRLEYPYEIAYAYYAQQQYDKAVNQLLPLKTRPDAHARVFQLLGNSYDMNRQGSKAMAVYEEGLKKFPTSGELHLELGNMMLKAENYDKALEYYEKGIKADPVFPSNYYWAAKLYCSSENEIWGMFYGEIFMNLERNSKRTGEISKMLFNVYKKEMTIDPGKNVGVSFAKNVIVVNSKSDIKKMKLPFTMIYETDMTMAVLPENQIDLSSLNRIRDRMVSSFFAKENAKDYPNILLDYQRKMQQAKHFEAYNYWLLSEGDPKAFTQWSNTNKDKWEAFITWFSANRLTLDKSHYFVSNQN